MDPASFKVFTNYVALPAREAFRIEYWALEEAKIRRQPAEKELSRRVAIVFGGANGIGREVARLAAARGAHVVVADRNAEAAQSLAVELGSLSSPEFNVGTSVDVRHRDSIAKALDAAVAAFGGVDILVNTAAIFPISSEAVLPDSIWPTTLEVNLTANYLLATEVAQIFKEQGLHGNIVFTSSANAVVPQTGSEAYDVSKAALSHLIRELAIGLAPNVRVNGISPATLVKGSSMFPRERVRTSLLKYNIPFQESFSNEELAQPSVGLLCRTHADPQGNRSGRLRRGNPVSGQPPRALHHRSPGSRRRRPGRGVSAVARTANPSPRGSKQFDPLPSFRFARASKRPRSRVTAKENYGRQAR